jgi:hypothetical protein
LGLVILQKKCRLRKKTLFRNWIQYWARRLSLRRIRK